MWIPDNLKNKWGWGWIIIALIFFSPQASKGYVSLGTIGEALQLFGCASAIVLYFLFRQKVLIKIKTTWVRSLSSGVIAYGIVWILLFLVGKTILSAQYSDDKTTKLIRSEIEGKKNDFVTSALEKFKKKDYNGALNDCNNALKDNPNSDVAYFTRGAIKSAIRSSISDAVMG